MDSLKSECDIVSFEHPLLKRVNFESDYAEKQKTIKEWVKEIFKNNELAIKNDLVLYLEFMRLTKQFQIKDFGDYLIIRIDKNNLLNLNVPESVSRIRRELKTDNEIKYDEKTEKLRERKAKEVRAYYKKTFHEFDKPITNIF